MTAAFTALPACVPLDLRCDTDRLTADPRSLQVRQRRLNRPISSEGLMAEELHDGRVLSIRAPGGSPDRTDAGGPGMVGFADAPWLARTPYFAEILAGIPAELRAARLMALGPGARVHEHRDGNLGMPRGRTRLHVPLVTNPGAVTVFEGREYHREAGRLWYGDLGRPRYVADRGEQTRIHLVIDCTVSLALLKLFPPAFTDGLVWSEVLLSRDPVPLNLAEMARYRCRFPVPAAFLDWSQDGCADDDLAASIDVVAGELVFSVGDQPRFSLVHAGAGEFRPQGWTDERTIRPTDGTSRIRFLVRRGSSVREWTRPAQRNS
jgi:hypothetical protein